MVGETDGIFGDKYRKIPRKNFKLTEPWGCMFINQHSVRPGVQVQLGLYEMLPKEKSPPTELNDSLTKV